MNNSNMKGLVLEGGGAKGAFQIGAYKALKELGIEFNGVVGTSIGALNGALIAQGDEEKAYDIWTQINPSRLFQLTEKQFTKLVNLDISVAEIPFFLGKVKDIVKNKGLDVSLIKDLLEEIIDEKKLRNSKIDFGLVTFSLTSRKPFELFLNEIPLGQAIEYLMASASFPIFKLEKLDGNLFIDGGVFDNMPINLLIKKGYEDIIVIRTYGLGLNKKVTDQTIKVDYINPSEDLGGVLDFDNKKANYNLQLGYFDTMKKFKIWKGKKYYIESEPDDERMFNFLLGISDKTIQDVGKIFGYENIPPKRMLFEFILPRISDLLNLSKESSYQDIVLGLSEEIAKDIALEKFKIYTFENFIKAITKTYSPKKGKIQNLIPSFMKQNEIISHFVRDSIFEEIASKIIQ
jgi:NTE family protein